MTENRQVFLCHASEDKPRVRAVFERLRKEGFDPWLDDESLLPGQVWEREIPRALRGSAAVILFLSKISVQKRGYVQREFKLAFDALQEIPDGETFVIPLRLDECEIPSQFRHLHWSSLKKDGLKKVVASLRRGIPRRKRVSAPSFNPTVSGAQRRRSSRTSGRMDLLRKTAISGPSAAVRRNAVRALGLEYGSRASKCLATVAWTSRYSAARCEAVEQVVNVEGRCAIAWCMEVAEEHPDNQCKIKAIEHVLSLEGVAKIGWAVRLLRISRDWYTRLSLGRVIYSAAQRNQAGRRVKDSAARSIREALPTASDRDDAREHLLGALIQISPRTSELRELVWRSSFQADTSYDRARCLALLLRAWPKHVKARKELKALSHDKEAAARALFRLTEKGQYEKLDEELLLGGR